MAKVLLLAANPAREPYPVYPLGLACVAAAVQAAGHTVRQLDYLASACIVGELAATLRSFQPDLVGVGLRNIDNTDSLNHANHLDCAAELLATIRSTSTAPVVLGGAAFSLAPETVLERLGADYGVVGEAEQSFPALVERIASGLPSPRVVRCATQAPLAELAPPLFDADAARFYLDATGLLNLQTKRGCPQGCVYCSYPALEGRNYRYRPVEAVIGDLERLHRDFGATHVFFTDSVFNDASGGWRELAEALARRKLPLRWSGYFRPDRIDREDVRLLKQSGLAAMELGADAATDATLEGLNKGFSFADVLAFHCTCRAEGVPVAHFIMFGGPAETARTVEEGLRNIALLEGAPVFVFSGIRVLPCTALATRAVAEGLIGPHDALLDPVYYFAPGLDPEAMNAKIRAAFRGNRLRLFPPAEAQARLDVMRRFGFKGLLWDRLVAG